MPAKLSAVIGPFPSAYPADGDESHSLRPTANPMAAQARTAHQHSAAYALVMQMLRYVAGFIAFHDEIDEVPSTKLRRGPVGRFTELL
jgi:hypothetical protein